MNEQKIIKLRLVEAFGRRRVYAECSTSRLLLTLTGRKGRKTFSAEQVSALEALGYTVHWTVEGVAAYMKTTEGA